MLATSLAGIDLATPIVLAAGTAGTLDELAGVVDLSRVGALTTKSLTPQPREGHPTWRIIPAPGGSMLNAIGLANPGVEHFEQHALPRAARLPCKVFVSVAGFSVGDFAAAAASADEWAAAGAGVAAVELNVSCPNVHTGAEFGHTPALLRELLAEVRPLVRHARLIVKLSPMTPDIATVALAAVLAGADALTIANTVPAMAIDVRTRRPRLSNVTGGLSGVGVHPIAVRLVHEVYTRVCRDSATPIIGLGGVRTWEDAAEFILAGATCVGLGTSLFIDPRTPARIARGLERWGRDQGVASLRELVGALRR